MMLLFSFVDVCWIVIHRKTDEYKEIVIPAGKTYEVRAYCFLQRLLVQDNDSHISVYKS